MQRQSLPVVGAVSQMRSIFLMESVSREKLLVLLILTSWASCCSFINWACKGLVDQESESKCIDVRLHNVIGTRLIDVMTRLSKCKKCVELHIYICAAVCLRLSRVWPWLKAIGQSR